MAVVAFGVRIGIRVSERGFLKKLKGVLPPGWKPARSTRVDHLFSLRVGGTTRRSRIRRFHLLYLDSTRLSRSMDLDDVLQALEYNLQFLVSLEAKGRLFVHAGVVAWKKKAILIPGISFSGKTTLVDALVRAGATYYSDEFAVLDVKGRVHAYPKPLALRNDDRRSKVLLTPKTTTRLRPLPVDLVLLCRFKKGSTWRPRRLTPAQAVLALLANTVTARVQPEFALTTLRRALRPATVLKSPRGEADEIVEIILSRLDQSPRRAA
jgi:hypothetical protein